MILQDKKGGEEQRTEKTTLPQSYKLAGGQCKVETELESKRRIKASKSKQRANKLRQRDDVWFKLAQHNTEKNHLETQSTNAEPCIQVGGKREGQG